MTSPSNSEQASELTRDEAERRLYRGIVRDTLQTFGFDVEEVVEMQKDMQFLRRLRQTSEAASGKTMTAIIGVFFSALGALLVLGIQQLIAAGGKH